MIGSGAAGVVPGYHVAAEVPPSVENSMSIPLPMLAKSGHVVMMFDPVPYLIFYRVTEEVEIVRVIHGARDYGVLFRDEDG